MRLENGAKKTRPLQVVLPLRIPRGVLTIHAVFKPPSPALPSALKSGFAAVAGAVTVKVVEGDGATALPHKTVATRAGLGWIGHSALLVTPEFGKSVRLASVLTDAPFICAEPVQETRCGRCRKCVDACPAGAVTGHPWSPGIARNRMLDAAACREKASTLAAGQGIDVTICGICILACPWTRRYLLRRGLLAWCRGDVPDSRLS